MGQKVRIVKVAHKIDSEFIVALYKKAKEKKGAERQKLVEQALLLSKHIGKYLTIEDKKEDSE